MITTTYLDDYLPSLSHDDYQPIADRVRQDHISSQSHKNGHAWSHTLVVSQLAEQFAFDSELDDVLSLARHSPLFLNNRRLLARMCWIAGILHSTDRIFSGNLEHKLRDYLLYVPVEKKEQDYIVHAVMNHTAPNNFNDPVIQVVLQDADRVANMAPDLWVRAGQHYQHLPAIDVRYVAKRDPHATYREPKTVLHDIYCSSEEWSPDHQLKDGEKDFRVRTPMAQRLALEFVGWHREGIRLVEQMMQRANLRPTPEIAIAETD